MKKNFIKKEIVKKSQNISRWYIDVVQKAELVEYGPVKGTMVIRPYGYAIWERVQEIFNQMIKEFEVDNAYFPIFIPYTLLEKEKEHIKGFSPELAIVTIGGGEKLSEPLVIRPTSEAIIHTMFAKWIKSWKDLPLKVNQWTNAVRWEKRTYPFLRTSEFLWQEGHTAHADEKNAMEMVNKAIEWYEIIYKEYYGIPIIIGKKSASETFAGAKETYTVEALMPDGKALQVATSHNLGQNFAKAFDITYQDQRKKNQYAWLTSWGLSTRSLGGLFLVHGDDNGLILPPRLASIQVIIIVVDEQGKKYGEKIAKSLKTAKIKVKIDSDFSHNFGWRINKWELKGVPLRIEIGKKEAREKVLTIVRRDTFEKFNLSKIQFIDKIENLLLKVQKNLYSKAYKFLKENTHIVNNYEEFKKIVKEKRGFLKAFWCEREECEKKIKEETKATTRVLPLDVKKEKAKCIYCKKKAVHRWYFAQAY